MRDFAYPTDISDTAWNRIASLIPAARSNKETGGRARATDMREVVNAILYRERMRCPWRMLPHDFPHWQIVRYYQHAWQQSDVWEGICAKL
jgi:putative transposase